MSLVFQLLHPSTLFVFLPIASLVVRASASTLGLFEKEGLKSFNKPWIGWTSGWIESHNWLAIAIDKELFIVPSDVSGHNRRPADVGHSSNPRIGWWTRSLQPSVERVLVGAIDKEVGEDGEVGFVTVTGTNVLENQQSLVIVLWI